MRRRLFLIAMGILAGCSGSSSDPVDRVDAVDAVEAVEVVDAVDTIDAVDAVELHEAFDPALTSYTPGVEVRGNVKILRLKGTPYEMGRQHAQFLHDELVEGAQFLQTDPDFSLLEPLAVENGYIDEATAQSYEAIREECRGMADVAGAEGWTYERCIALAWGDVILENVGLGSISCSQFIATGAATGGGEMVHGRNLDWDKIDFLLQHPTLIVRHPTGKIPYVVVGFPGNVATYNGINAAGISCGSNQNHAKPEELGRAGRSEIQMLNEILANATSLADIEAFFATEERTVGNNLVFADGDHDTGAVFEMTKYHLAQRKMDATGVVFATNHYIVPDMVQYGVEVPAGKSTRSRFARLEELLLPDGRETLYGTLDLASAVTVLRDRYNPLTMVTAPEDAFDDQGTIANNGCVYSIVFAPKRRAFWLASGDLPIPMNPYQGFTLDELFGDPDAPAPDPAQIP